MPSNRNIYQTLSDRGIKEDAYQTLLEHGRRRGSIHRDEVADVIPEAEFDNSLAEIFVEAINGEGVTVEDIAVVNEVERFPDDETGVADLSDLENEAGDISLTGVDVDDILRMYLREAAQIPLLNHSEEVELVRRIERCRHAYQELSSGGVPQPREEELYRVIEEGRIAREHLIRANTRLVVSVAKRYLGHDMPFTDLIQEGNIGLMRAIRNYDYRRGFKFSTYATWWIRQAISRALADQSRTIRLPAYISDQMGRLRRTQLELQQRLGRMPTKEELAEAMGMPAARIGQMLESLSQPMSLEAPVSESEESELGDLLEDANAVNPEEAVADQMDRESVYGRIADLPERERLLIELRYGMGGEEPLTLAEVGQRLGITRERARQLEMQALERMRNPEAAARRKRRGPAPASRPPGGAENE
jgi:RNA polymerase primary sigma factor